VSSDDATVVALIEHAAWRSHTSCRARSL